jgi:hypothetical protein
MAITYTWSVDKVKITNEGTYTNSIVQTHWTVTGTDENGTTGTFRGGTPFTAIGSTSTFVPYEELTEAEVISWIQGVVAADPVYSSHINERIIADIAVQEHTEVHAHELPWASTGTVLTAADLNPGHPDPFVPANNTGTSVLG